MVHPVTDNPSESTDLPGGSVSPEAARAALRRIVASAPFRGAPQLVSFLTYIVEAALAGRAAEIKGYTIAVEALGRPVDFDPVVDPIVRVEAGRLRRALEAYYAQFGAEDEVRIAIPRGAYVPVFVRAGRREKGGDAAEAATPAPAVAAPAAAPPPPDRPAPVSAQLGRPSPRFGVPAALALAGVVVVAAGALLLGLGQGRPPATPAAISGAAPTALDDPLLQHSTAGRILPVIRVVALPSNDAVVDRLSQSFSDNLTDALARFDEFVVLDTPGEEQTPNRQGGLVYRLEHRGLAVDDAVAAAIRLVHEPSGRVVWAGQQDVPMETTRRLIEVRELARRTVVRLAQPYGVIHADLRAQALGDAPMACLVRAYDYWTAPSEPRHAEVRACLERATSEHPKFHPAWALLSFMHLDEYRVGFNPRPGDALERARLAAQRAVMLAPESGRALQALMAIYTVSGETQAAVRTGWEAVRRNPFDTDILADVGSRLVQAGQVREGRQLLLRAADLNIARPPWHDFYLYLSARSLGDLVGERSALRSLAGVEAPLALLAQVMHQVDLGDIPRAREAMAALAQASPTFGRDPREFLDRAFFAPDVRELIMEQITRARS